jgi:solute carrier family 12 (potassium/chloride transporters), member 9
MGIVLFLRLSWITGQAGVFQTIGMLTVGEIQSALTVLSLAAMASNGRMRGGGSYYMMSRSLGIELGGAVGILFYTAFAVSCAFYAIGFATEVQETWFQHNDSKWLLAGIASGCLLIVLSIAYVGAGWFTKINVPLFAVQFGAIWVGLLTMWFRGHDMSLEHGGEYETPSLSRLNDNLYPAMNSNTNCDGQCNTRIVYGILFPAVTGIMEGANLSGDLKDPAKSIGKGTLLAVATAYGHYIVLIITFAASFPRDTLRTNTTAFQDAAATPYVMIVGVIISSLSSSLGACFGGSRVLQSLGADHVLPGLSFFAKGSRKGNEPRRAVLFTWLVAQLCVFIGDLDVVSPLISSFFCLSYAMTNLACFLLRISGTTNFRPAFTYFSWHTALIGFLMNIAVMFFLDLLYASVSLVMFIGIVCYLLYKAPDTAWGDVRQAIIYHQVRKFLLKLDTRKTHGKLWRPSVLLYVDDLDHPIVEFCNNLKKGGLYLLGAPIVGDYNEMTPVAMEMSDSILNFIDESKIKAFPQVVAAPTARVGYQSLLQLSGLGAMTANTVVIPVPKSLMPQNEDSKDAATNELKEQHRGRYSSVAVRLQTGSWDSSFLSDAVGSSQEYVHIMSDVRSARKNLVLAHHFDQLSLPHHTTPLPDSPQLFQGLRKSSASVASLSGASGGPRYLDVWLWGKEDTSSWSGFDGTPLLQLQLAHILKLTLLRDSANVQIRIIRVVSPEYADSDSLEHEHDAILDLVKESRISVASVRIVAIADSDHDIKSYVSRHRLDLEDEEDHDMGYVSRQGSVQHNADGTGRTPLLSSPASRPAAGAVPKLVLNRDVGVGIEIHDVKDAAQLNGLIQKFSSSSYIIFSELPAIPDEITDETASKYLELQEVLVAHLPPTCLVGSHDTSQQFSRDV